MNSDLSLQTPSFSNQNHSPKSAASTSNPSTEAYQQPPHSVLVWGPARKHFQICLTFSCLFFFNWVAHICNSWRWCVSAGSMHSGREKSNLAKGWSWGRQSSCRKRRRWTSDHSYPNRQRIRARRYKISMVRLCVMKISFICWISHTKRIVEV